MAITDEQLKTAAGILHRVVTDNGAKLQYGSMKRSEIKAQLRKNQKVSGYRVEWLRNTRDEIIKVMEKAALDFNNANRHDRISVTDMNDALTTTQYALEVYSKKGTKGSD